MTMNIRLRLATCLALLLTAVACTPPSSSGGSSASASAKGAVPAVAHAPAAASAKAAAPAAAAAPAGVEPGVTMENFSKLKTGMTLAQVNAIFGSEGTEMSSTEIAGIKGAIYKWEAGFVANVTVQFQNGKMISKGQFGLK